MAQNTAAGTSLVSSPCSSQEDSRECGANRGCPNGQRLASWDSVHGASIRLCLANGLVKTPDGQRRVIWFSPPSHIHLLRLRGSHDHGNITEQSRVTALSRWPTLLELRNLPELWGRI